MAFLGGHLAQRKFLYPTIAIVVLEAIGDEEIVFKALHSERNLVKKTNFYQRAKITNNEELLSR